MSAHYSNAGVAPELRHALAALALDGQSFGFTHADIDALETCATEWATTRHPHGEPRLTSIADRIRALLPPKEKP